MQEDAKGPGELSSEERLEVLRQLAKACKAQGAFQLACKKYTQVHLYLVYTVYACLCIHSGESRMQGVHTDV